MSLIGDTDVSLLVLVLRTELGESSLSVSNCDEDRERCY